MATARAPIARLRGLDHLRGAALVLMLVHHLTKWLVGEVDGLVPGWADFVVTDVAAPAFAVAAGSAAWSFGRSQEARGRSLLEVFGGLVRRYGLLVVIGIALAFAVGGRPAGFGVLETLGMSVLLAYVIARSLPERWLVAAAAGTLVIAPLIERASTGSGGWLAQEVLTGAFPLPVYVGFVLAGMASAALVLDGRDRPGPSLWAGLALAVATPIVASGPPDRYPGDASFVLPGLAGTFLLYAALAYRATSRPGADSMLDRLLDSAGAHALGIFITHYLFRGILKWAGLLGSVDPVPGLLLALAITLGLVMVAPHVPQPSWSLRSGRRRRLVKPEPAPSASATTASAGPSAR